MALFDWNHDGKKDWQDDFLEYHYIYNKPKEDKKSYTTNSGDLATIVGTILLIIAGLIVGAGLCTILGI